MNKTTEALKLAEKYLTWLCDPEQYGIDFPITGPEALAAIREVLADHSGDANEMVAKPVKQKPVGWVMTNGVFTEDSFKAKMDSDALPVYREPVDATAIRADVTQVDWTDKQNQLHALSKIGGYYHDGPYRLGIASEGCHEIAKAIGSLK